MNHLRGGSTLIQEKKNLDLPIKNMYPIKNSNKQQNEPLLNLIPSHKKPTRLQDQTMLMQVKGSKHLSE